MEGKFTIEDLKRRQALDIEAYFPTYRKRPWQPIDDDASDRFYQSCIRSSGPMVLRDVQHAIDLVLGIKFEEEELVPRSVYNPDLIRSQCEAQTNGGRMEKYDPTILKAAFEKVRRMFTVPKLKPLPLEEVPYQPDTSAGLPTMRKKAEDYPRAIQAARKLQQKEKAAPPPTVLFHRGKNPEAARYVNGYPFEMTLLEGRFFYPYQSAVIKHHTPYAGGRYDFETGVLLNEVTVKSRFIAELDYSKFDTSIPAELSSMAFRIVRESFVMDEQDRRDWERITRYFHTSPFLCPDGYIYSGRRHGVPSGSNFTQIIDSIVNAILLEYVARRQDFKLVRYFVLGDDVVMGVDRPISLEATAATLQELGIKLNLQKSKVHACTEPIHFLGHDVVNMTMRRELRETLVKLMTPERPKRDYVSKRPDVRRTALIQRIRDYQDDNPDAWEALEALVLFYQASDHIRKEMVLKAKETGMWPGKVAYIYYNQWYGPMDVLEINERARWDYGKRDRRRGNHRGQAVFF
jgi:hypothetical protein